MKELSKVIKFLVIKIEKTIFNLVLRFVFKKDITIISSNCIGTRIYQSAKKKYTSPTINLWFKPADFIKFTEQLDFYLEQELIEYSDPGINYPCGKLCDVIIFFQHYMTFDEAKIKWQERTKRACTNNPLIIFTDRDGATIQDIKRIAKQKNVIVFCSSDKKQYLESVPNIVFIDGSESQVGDLYSNYHQMLYRFPFKKVSKL
ncbi:DUF1919 domain-containing protein [Enterobacter cloacae subsp. dissolvens]|uniref:DUF1919 domain-containing protein n=1 Tax=Enterobacter cloacae TaxID=550 RepID=UPI0007B389D5|nr:DUF1919 domain-containing protein [Enterobacter cloacae]KZP67943.1 hypothetical protein A3N40_17805 [Enterobacter cloacae subsp. dissolvens]MEA5213921.1 DUF1919 domain-containing protein [Enterobacter cloacae]RXX45925.1 DUF1919 domain-containing protein [Enterobacter cloacae]